MFTMYHPYFFSVTKWLNVAVLCIFLICNKSRSTVRIIVSRLQIRHPRYSICIMKLILSQHSNILCIFLIRNKNRTTVRIIVSILRIRYPRYPICIMKLILFQQINHRGNAHMISVLAN